MSEDMDFPKYISPEHDEFDALTGNSEQELYGDLSMDAGAGESDYSVSLTFTSSKFIVIAFGHDRGHSEDVLQCVLKGRFHDKKGDREFRKL